MNIPNGFISNDNVGPLLFSDFVGNSLQLSGNNVNGLVGLSFLLKGYYINLLHLSGISNLYGSPYLEGLSDADNDVQSTFHGGLCLACNKL